MVAVLEIIMANFFENIINQFNLAKPQEFLTSETPVIKTATKLKVGTENFFKPIIDKFVSAAPKLADIAVKVTAPLSIAIGTGLKAITAPIMTEEEKQQLGKTPFAFETAETLARKIPIIGQIPGLPFVIGLGAEIFIPGLGGEEKILFEKFTKAGKKDFEESLSAFTKRVGKENVVPSELPVSSLEGIEPIKNLDRKKIEFAKKEISAGIKNPLIVDETQGKLKVIDGNHRLQAYKELGITDNIPVITTRGVGEKISPNIPIAETKISPLTGGGRPPIEPPVKPLSYGTIIPPESTLVNRVVKALKEAKPIRVAQEKLYTIERAKRFGAAEAVGKEIKGEAGFRAELSKLAGELPKREFESLRGKLTQGDVDNLFQMVKENPWLKFTETLSARTGLVKMIEGSVPTKGELELLNKVFPPEMLKELLNKRPLLQRLKDIGLNLANLPRSFMSTLDLSFGGRQGIFAAPTFRKEFWNSWKAQFKMFGSERAFQEVMQAITKNPYFNLAKESGLSFTNMASKIGQREERFASNWGDSIPLIKQSSRAYTGFANKFRMDVFASMARDIEATGVKLAESPKMAREVASLVNAMTGRGDLPKVLSRAAPALNAFFFSPRLMASRIRLLTDPAIYITSSAPVRKQAWKSLMGFTGYGITVLTLAELAGARIGTDPNSSDFGKIIVGNTRIDMWGGFQQYVRMTSQLISGKYVSSVTGKEITLGEGYKPLTRFDILQRQIESKEAPIFSFITALLKGKNYKGEPLDIPSEIGQRFVPMVAQDIYEIAKDEPELLPLGILGIFGIGLQTYEPQKPFSKGINQGGIGGKGIRSNKGIGK